MFDQTTAAAYLAAGTDLARAQAVRDSLGSGTLTVSIKDGATEKYSGTFTGPLTAASDGDLSAAVRLAGTVTGTGTPDASTWTIKISNASDRWLQGTLGSAGRFQSSAALVVGQSVRLAFSIGATGTVSQTGVVAVTLDYAPDITGLQTVSFGMPFPRGVLMDASLIQVETAGGVPVPTDSVEILPWRHLTDVTLDGTSLRSVLVTFQHDTASSSSYQVRYGSPRSSSYSSGVTTANVRDNWRTKAAPLVSEHPATDNYERDPFAAPIYEPKIWAALPSAWLMSCEIRGHVAAMSNTTMLAFMLGCGGTITNDVNADATSYSTYSSNGWSRGLVPWNAGSVAPYSSTVDPTPFEMWLFERSFTILNSYIQTGDVKWLRRAHRSAQFYASYISTTDGAGLRDPYPGRKAGSWSFKANGQWAAAGDLKYSTAGGILGNIILSGDMSVAPKVAAIAAFVPTQARSRLPAITVLSGTPYTERNLGTVLESLMYSYEITGTESYKTDAIALFEGMMSDIASPPAGYPADMKGVLWHTAFMHEGWWPNSTEFVFSPWMVALFAETLERYYRFTDDTRALRLIYDYAALLSDPAMNGWKFTASNTYVNGVDYGHGVTYLFQYEASRNPTKASNEEYGNGDREHAYDVLGLLYRGWYAGSLLSLDTTNIEMTIARAIPLADARIRTLDLVTPGFPTYNIGPWRKYNWWFGSTSSIDWHIAQVA